MRTKKAIGINATDFSYSLHVEELNNPSNFDAEVEMSEGGIHLVWTREILTPYITLVSGEHGWIEKSVKDSIMSMYVLLGSSFILRYDDGSSDNVRFAHEKGIDFIPIYEGSETYTTKINLALIII